MELHDFLHLVGQEEEEGYQPDDRVPWSWIHAALGRVIAASSAGRRCSGLVLGEEVGGEMADGERSCEQCDRGRKAASVGNAGLLERPGCP